MKSPYCNYVADILYGFVPQRQFLQNVIDLDVRARRDGMPDPSHKLPALVFWDIATAFPSLSHEWLWIFLECVKLRLGFTNVVKSLYRN